MKGQQAQGNPQSGSGYNFLRQAITNRRPTHTHGPCKPCRNKWTWAGNVPGGLGPGCCMQEEHQPRRQRSDWFCCRSQAGLAGPGTRLQKYCRGAKLEEKPFPWRVRPLCPFMHMFFPLPPLKPSRRGGGAAHNNHSLQAEQRSSQVPRRLRLPPALRLACPARLDTG